MPGDFYNPYSFVPPADPKPADPKGAGKYKADTPNEHPLGQGRPAGHDRYRPGLWSGRIGITIEAATPLLIPEAVPVAEIGTDGHKVFRTRRAPGTTDTPLLPVTSFKGPLRSAYEAITNSRFSVFRGHGAPLARRMLATEGLGMVPVRVIKEGVNLNAELLVGTTKGWPTFNAANGRWIAPGPLYAAWLPFRGARILAKGNQYKHGAVVDVKLQLIQHTNPHFRFWEVVAIKGISEVWSESEKRQRAKQTNERNYVPAEREGRPVFTWGRGYVCRTNHNIKNKHDERVFFVGADDEREIDDAVGAVSRVPIGEPVAGRWRELIRECQNLHQDAIEKRIKERIKPSTYVRARNPNEEDQPAFSRHTYEADVDKLDHGTLAYALLEVGPNGQAKLSAKKLPTIAALFPVMIGRELGNWSPYDMLQEELRPATNIDQLSPADRVFGWVRDERANRTGGSKPPSDLPPPAAWKGQLRIGPIGCDGVFDDRGEALKENGRAAPAIQSVGDNNGLPLAILSTPKPSQARFYAARDKKGTPFENGADILQKGYFERRPPQNDAPQAGLRGRKVYPHHRAAGSVFRDYWNPSEAWKDAGAGELARVPRTELYREYVRCAETAGQPKRDSQNRSVRDWVRTGTRFSTHIDVVNLNSAELGALLWLLDLGRKRSDGQPPAHLRIGGGKPLGFGSVRVWITSLDLADGAAKRLEYRSFLGFSQTEPAADENSILRLMAKDGAVSPVLDASDGPVAAFRTAIENAYGDSFSTVPFIESFLIAARGFADNLPLHYPRRTPKPDPDGKNYEWFVQNQHQDGQKLSLPDIRTDTGLPRRPRA